jgi:hypothetical protein
LLFDVGPGVTARPDISYMPDVYSAGHLGETSILSAAIAARKDNMSTHRQSYLLNDERQRERLQALANSPNTLEDERVLCKYLCEQAANAGHAGLAATIAQTIAKISRIEIQNQVATGQLISRDQAIALIRMVVDAVSSEIEGLFVGWEDCLDRIGDRIGTVMQQKPLQLEDQR